MTRRRPTRAQRKVGAAMVRGTTLLQIDGADCVYVMLPRGQTFGVLPDHYDTLECRRKTIRGMIDNGWIVKGELTPEGRAAFKEGRHGK